MSLLDVLDKHYGSSGSSGYQGTDFGLEPTYGSQVSTQGTSAARNSRERGAPERVDINNFVKDTTLGAGEPPVGMQALEIAGRAPGFILERPLATGQQILKDSTGFDLEGAVGNVPILGQVLGTAGDVLSNVQNLPAALANAGVAEALKQGTREGWSDDKLITYTNEWDRFLNGVPVASQIFSLLGNKPVEQITWGEFKARAQKRGWTSDDVKDLVDGKSPWDYGNRAVTEDGLEDVAFRMLTDPTNLIMGAGAVLQVPKGIGFLAKAIRAGAELEKPLAASLAAGEISQGVAKSATWLGMAKYFEQIGRGVGYVPGGARAIDAAGKGATLAGRAGRTYRNVALKTTAAELGIAAVDQAMGGRNTPHSGFLEDLFQANRRIIDNQPLSQNQSFSLFSAFLIGPHNVLGPAVGTVKTGLRRFEQAGTRGQILDALSEGMAGSRQTRHATVLEQIGGEDGLNNLIYHVHSRAVFDRVMRNPVLRASLSGYKSFDEGILNNHVVKEVVDAEIAQGLKEGRLSARETVQALRDWHGNRDGVNHSVEFPWDGQQAIDRWNEYRAAAAPVSKIYYERLGAVVGLVEDLTKEHIAAARAVLTTKAANGMVSIADIRAMLSRYPQLLNDEKAAWEKYLTKEYDGQSVPLKNLQGKLRRASNHAPSLREITAEAAAAEAGALRVEDPHFDPETIPQTVLSEDSPSVVTVSRMRPSIRRRLGLGMTSLDDVLVARSDPEVAHFETNAGDALHDAGFDIQHVTQSVGAWEGKLEPSIEVAMPNGSLHDLRLAASLVGKAGEQDAVAISVSGRRLTELGLAPNGVEVVIALPSTNKAALGVIVDRLGRDFPGYTVNDTTGVLRVLVPEGKLDDLAASLKPLVDDIQALYPKDLIGDTGLRHSIRRAYIEFPHKSRGEGSYESILRDARTVRDPRAAGDKTFKERLAYRGGAEGVAPGAAGSGAGLAGAAADAGGSPADLALPPAQRVGLGTRDRVVTEAGYLYRSVDPTELVDPSFALRREAPRNAGTWGDGHQTPRNYFTRTASLLTEDQAIVRIREQGRVVNDSAGEPYLMRQVKASELEVLGGDGQWYPLRDFYTPAVEPEIADAAARVSTAYSPVTRTNFGRRMAEAFGGDEEQAQVYDALGDAMSASWASRTGRPAEEWYGTVLADIQSGGEADGLNQIAIRNARVAQSGADIRALIEEPVPDVLASHGLGGESSLEWIEAGGRNVAIPGGVEGLKTGEFTLWDLWRLKAQGINPAVLPEAVRIGLYQKLFRTQARALTNPVDAFNRVAFATLSPLTNLTQNEALLSFVRARDMGGILRLADIADKVEAAAKAAGKPAAKINSEIGFAVQQAVGLLAFDRGVKTITTNGALASVAKAARVFRDHPEWFVLREGEDLIQYSERLMNVLPGSDMKVGNFGAMLGNPVAFDRGTIDSHIVELLHREGRITDEVANQLRDKKTGKLQNADGQKLTYRLANGEINPALPEHLRDLPVEPARNQVVVYGATYQILNEALNAKYAENAMHQYFGLGGYQWYEWDLKRGKFEPHTVIFPGSHELPPIEQAALGGAIDAHREMGYFTKEGGLYGTSVSPTRALYYQEAPRPGPHTQMVSVDVLKPAIRENREAFPRAGQGATSLDELTASIQKNGFDPTRPIVLRYDPTHKRVYIEDGNHRIAAAQRLGMTDVPVVVMSAGPQAKVRAGSMPVAGAVDAPRGQLIRPSDIGLEGKTLYQSGVVDRLNPEAPSGLVRTNADLTNLERRVIQDYQATFATNEPLRIADGNYDDHMVRTLDGIAARMAPTEEAMTLYRGVSPRVGELLANAADNGRPYSDPAFMSTSQVEGQMFDSGTKVRIEVPAGSKVIPIDDISDVRLPSEEVLLPRGSQFDVTREGDWFVLKLRDEATSYDYAADRKFLDRAFAEPEIKRLTGLRDAAQERAQRYVREDGSLSDRQSHAWYAGIANEYDAEIAKLQSKLRQVDTGPVVKGSAELLDSGQAVIRGVTNPDFSTGVHELWHAAQRHIDDADTAVMERVYGVENGVWLTEHQEQAARDFERYLRNGQAPTPALQGVFAKMKQFLVAVYARLKGSPIEKQIHPEIKGVFDRALTELPAELRPTPRPDPLTVGLRALEDEGRAPGVQMDEAALRAELAALSQQTVLTPEEAARAQNVQRLLEAAMLAKGERRSGAVLWAAGRDAEVSRVIPLHRSLEDRPAEVRADLARLEADLAANYGPYTLKAPPKLSLFFDEHQGNLIAEHLKNRNALGEALATWGPFGRINRFLEWLTMPVQNQRLGRAAMQALYNELLPHGATTTEVKRFWNALQAESNLHSVGPFEVRAFKNGTSLTQQAINKIAAGDPVTGKAGIFNDKVIKAVGHDGFSRAIDRASNRFYRTMEDISASNPGARGALARGFTKTYDLYQPTALGSAQRYVSKTMYHWFRFLSDPRWWAMNIFEADFLGGLRYGLGATRATGAHRAAPTLAAAIHGAEGAGERAAKMVSEAIGQDTGWLYTRRLGGYVSRGFDHERPETTLAVLRGLADDDPVLADLKARFGNGTDDIVEGIDKMLYEWDTKGPSTTLIDEARSVLGDEETRRLMPFLQKVYQRHEQTYKDIVQTFHGNPNRSNLERLGNSYWLYWPLSYQVKATKWLVDVMTHRAFGKNTNLAGAALYANFYEDHKRRMAEDPEYARTFTDHPTMWYLAQMMFPITPGDIGVSLSRPVRYTGGKLGLWGEYKNAQDPVSAAGAVLSLGPAYTAELMARIGSEAFAKNAENIYPTLEPTGFGSMQAQYGP